MSRRRNPHTPNPPGSTQQPDDDITIFQQEHLAALQQRHSNLVHKINHPYVILLSLAAPSVVMHLLLSPESPFSSLVTNWYKQIFLGHQQRIYDGLEFDFRTADVKESTTVMNRFLEHLRQKGVKELKRSTNRDISAVDPESHSVGHIINFMDEHATSEVLGFYKQLFVEYMVRFVNIANSLTLELTASTTELRAAIANNPMTKRFVIPEDIYSYSLHDIYKLVVAMNERLDLYNNMQDAYQPMYEQQRVEITQEFASIFAKKDMLNMLSRVRLLSLLSSYFLFMNQLIKRISPQGIFQKSFLTKVSEKNNSNLSHDEAERKIKEYEEACRQLAINANRHEVVARALLVITCMLLFTTSVDELSTESTIGLAAFTALTLYRSVFAIKDWWQEYRYEETVQARQQSMEQIFKAISQKTEIIYDYHDIGITRLQVTFEEHHGLKAKAVAKVIQNVLRVHGVEITHVLSDRISVSLSHSLSNDDIKAIKNDINSALTQERKARGVYKQLEPVLRKTDCVIRPVLKQGFLKHIQINLAIPKDQETVIKDLFADLVVQVHQRAHDAIISVEFSKELDKAKYEQFVGILHNITKAASRASASAAGVPDTLSMKPGRPIRSMASAEPAAGPVMDSKPRSIDENDEPIALHFPSGTYRSDAEGDIHPINAGRGLANRYFALFRCRREDFRTEKMYNDYKNLVDNPKIVAPKGHDGIKFVAATEKGRGGKYQGAVAKAKIRNYRYRLAAREEVLPTGEHLLVFYRVVKKIGLK